MNKLNISAKDVKTLFFPNQKSMNATYKLMAKYKKIFEKQGYSNALNSRNLPKEWFFNQIKNDMGYSELEIEQMKKTIERRKKDE